MARLLLVLPEYPPTVGGMQTHAIHAVRHWGQRHDVRVITYRSPDAKPDGARRVLSRLSYWYNVREIEMQAREFRPDLIYASTVYYGTVADRTGVPVVCRSVGNDVQRPWIAYPFERGADWVARPGFEDQIYKRFRKMRKPERWDRILREERDRLLRRALIGNSFVFANSEYTRDLIEAQGYPPNQILVTAGGVETRDFAGIRRADREVRRFLTVCRLVPKKGIETLLEAWREFAPRKTRLRIVGDGPLRAKLERNAPRGVTFAGRVPYDAIAAEYAEADAFVLPSCEHRQNGGRVDVETMGRVFCEAGAAGLPVIATRTGGVATVVRDGENGLLVTPGDTRGLVEAMRRLRDDPILARRLGEAGRRRAQREWDWAIVLGRQESLMEELAGVGVVPSRSSSNIR